MKPNYQPSPLIERWIPPKGWRFAICMVMILIMMIGVDLVILETGGIQYAYIHLMYIPIMFAGILFSWPGGILAGILAGVIAGPLIPLDTITHQMQSTSNWGTRLFFFALIGGIAGFMSGLLVKYIENMRWLANHQIKSKLPNRLNLESVLDQKLKENAPPFYLVVISVLNYDQICDLFGYEASDKLIQTLQEHIAERFPRITYYAHYHPERLALIINKSWTNQDADPQRPLINLLEESLPLNNIQVHLHTAFGYVDSTLKSPVTAEELIQMAEIALYYAKTKRMECAEFNYSIQTVSKETLIYMGALRDAIANDELELYFQPKLDLNTQKIAGAEALVRWNSPTMGFIAPDKFIPQAEKTQIIQPLTRWVIEAAFKTVKLLVTLDLPIKVSINLSTKNLTDPSLFTFIKEMLDREELDPALIEFEITESGIMDNPDEAIIFMHKLKDTGFTLSIDDYGTGYASLTYLKKLPIDALKIDQSFVKDIKMPTSHEIISSTINMAKALNLKTIAEGVESKETAETLKNMGCDMIQGYLYSKPIKYDEFADFLKKHTHLA